MSAIKITSELLSDELIAEITAHINEELARGERRAIPMDSIHVRYGYKVDLKPHQFKGALSKSVEEKRLPGLVMKRGKAGGIGVDDGSIPEPKKTSKPRAKKTEDAVDEIVDISIGTANYFLPLSAKKVRNLFIPIFDLELDPNGDITIGDESFTAADASAHKFMANCIAHMLTSSSVAFNTETDDSDDSEESDDIRKSA